MVGFSLRQYLLRQEYILVFIRSCFFTEAKSAHVIAYYRRLCTSFTLKLPFVIFGKGNTVISFLWGDVRHFTKCRMLRITSLITMNGGVPLFRDLYVIIEKGIRNDLLVEDVRSFALM
jgi:hypothetical protein